MNENYIRVYARLSLSMRKHEGIFISYLCHDQNVEEKFQIVYTCTCSKLTIPYMYMYN